jgi:outer membrane lipoprotein-sorting protein
MLEHFLPSAKVVMAIRLDENKAYIEDKKYEGTTKEELEQLLIKLNDSNFNFNISPKELPKLLQDAYEWGQIETTVIIDDKNKMIRGYKVSSLVAGMYDSMLQQVGLLEIKKEVKLKL